MHGFGAFVWEDIRGRISEDRLYEKEHTEAWVQGVGYNQEGPPWHHEMFECQVTPYGFIPYHTGVLEGSYLRAAWARTPDWYTGSGHGTCLYGQYHA